MCTPVMSVLQTFEVANSVVHLREEGKLDPQEWRTFVSHSPNIISNMTLPVLRCVISASSEMIATPHVLVVKA